MQWYFLYRLLVCGGLLCVLWLLKLFLVCVRTVYLQLLQCARFAFRDQNSQNKVWQRYLASLKHQERYQDINKGPNENFRGCKKLSEVELMCLVVKLKEPKFLIDEFRN